VNPRLAIPALLALWGLLLAVALEVRPLLPVNETRYVGVAWEMWLRGDFLVPYLNGEPYSHKPPLLFWLIQAGWAVFGVNEWWPRLVAPLVSLLVMALAVHLARLLWPGDRRART
jgi:4-amino-4-deoxy-L-arabinose transferase-like glycosyltransferase